MTKTVLPIDLSYVAKETFIAKLYPDDINYLDKLRKRFENFLNNENIEYRHYLGDNGNVLYIIENLDEYKYKLNTIANITYPISYFDEYQIELSYGA